eukprot:jgi/Botrbrau1/22671/Bobra.0132s0015.3
MKRGAGEPNLVSLLRQRELASHAWPPAPARTQDQTRPSPSVAIADWVESDFLSNCTAAYCPLGPPPRSTIAIAFSPDGSLLASTHGDHTVKLLCSTTRKLLKVLQGHARTPWVVRFHPLTSKILASGSLDHEVRIWNTETGNCLFFHKFGRPIASLAFYLDGEMLAVAAGRHLYMWAYKKSLAEGGQPVPVLKTRRSLRCVQFSPCGAPYILTAETDDQKPVTELRWSARAPVTFPGNSPHGGLPREDYAAWQAGDGTWSHARQGAPSAAGTHSSSALRPRVPPAMARARGPPPMARRSVSVDMRRAASDEATWDRPRLTPHAAMHSTLRSYLQNVLDINEQRLARQVRAGEASPGPADMGAPLGIEPLTGLGFQDSREADPHARGPGREPTGAPAPGDPGSWALLSNQEIGAIQNPSLQAAHGSLETMNSDQHLQHRSHYPNASSLERPSASVPEIPELPSIVAHPQSSGAPVRMTGEDFLAQPSRDFGHLGGPLTSQMPEESLQARIHGEGVISTGMVTSGWQRVGEQELPARGLGQPDPASSQEAAGLSFHWHTPRTSAFPSRTGTMGHHTSQPAPDMAVSSRLQDLPQAEQPMLDARSVASHPLPMSVSVSLGAGSVNPPQNGGIGPAGAPAVEEEAGAWARRGDRRPLSPASSPPAPRQGFEEMLPPQLRVAGEIVGEAEAVLDQQDSRQDGAGVQPAWLEYEQWEERFRGLRIPSQPPEAPLERSTANPEIVWLDGDGSDGGRLSRALEPMDTLQAEAGTGDFPASTLFHIRGRVAEGISLRSAATFPSAENFSLPPSMVPVGTEYPASLVQQPHLATTASPGLPMPPSHIPLGGLPSSLEATAADVAAVAAAAASQGGPGHDLTGRLRVILWQFDASLPQAPLRALHPKPFQISNCVLCSEMGVHFSPCGRMLAVCVACRGSTEAEGVICELRIYSLERALQGRMDILAARQVFGASCLTTIQFSPTSRHVMLAYGRKDPLLFRSLTLATTSRVVPLHTVLEVYSVPDMRLVGVMPSAEDEVNAAAFHPRKV